MNKKQFISKWARTFMIVLLGAGLAAFTSCEKDPVNPTPDPDPVNPTPGGNTHVDPWADLVNETHHDAQLDGNTLTYGNHVYTVNGELDYNSTIFNEPTTYVTFTNVPSGYTEFKAVYENLLGFTPQGAAAMVPMAMEIYGRDENTGKQCFDLLCNSSATVSEIIRELKRKFIPSSQSPENDPYIQRYLPAAVLEGAANTNAYAPNEPYTVEMCANPNGIQDAPLTGGTVYYTYILAPGGWDTFQRTVQVFQPYNSNIYQVFSCPATYVQCKNIQGTWQGLK